MKNSESKLRFAFDMGMKEVRDFNWLLQMEMNKDKLSAENSTIKIRCSIAEEEVAKLTCQLMVYQVSEQLEQHEAAKS